MIPPKTISPAWENEFPPILSFDSAVESSIEEGVRFRATYVGGRNWSLKTLSDEDPVVRREFSEALSWQLAEHSIVSAYAPYVGAMSGAIVPSKSLTDRILLPYGNELRRKMDLPAEGVPLLPNEALIASVGGCGVGIATGDGRCIAAHMGRESLLDHSFIVGRGLSRPHLSVVNAMAEYALALGTQARHMTFRCLFQLPLKTFEHPRHNDQYGEYNRKMGAFVADSYGPHVAHAEGDSIFLDMHALPLAQAKQQGFHVDLDANMPLPHAGDFGYTRHPFVHMKERRNLLIVHRLS